MNNDIVAKARLAGLGKTEVSILGNIGFVVYPSEYNMFTRDTEEALVSDNNVKENIFINRKWYVDQINKHYKYEINNGSSELLSDDNIRMYNVINNTWFNGCRAMDLVGDNIMMYIVNSIADGYSIDKRGWVLEDISMVYGDKIERVWDFSYNNIIENYINILRNIIGFIDGTQMLEREASKSNSEYSTLLSQIYESNCVYCGYKILVSIYDRDKCKIEFIKTGSEINNIEINNIAYGDKQCIQGLYRLKTMDWDKDQVALCFESNIKKKIKDKTEDIIVYVNGNKVDSREYIRFIDRGYYSICEWE